MEQSKLHAMVSRKTRLLIQAGLTLLAGAACGVLWEQRTRQSAGPTPLRLNDSTTGTQTETPAISPDGAASSAISLAGVLNAPDHEMLPLLMAFLPHAGIDELRALADGWPAGPSGLTINQETAFLMLFDRWLELAPKEALRRSHRYWFWETVQYSLFTRDPELVLTLDLKMKTGRSGAPFRAILYLAKTDVNKALERLGQMPRKSSQFYQTLKFIAVQDMKAALRFALEHDTGHERMPCLSSILSTVAREDVDRAMQIAEENGLSQVNRALVTSMIVAAARSQPERAIHYWRNLSPGYDRAQMVHLLARSYAERDVQTALTWARETLIGDEQQAALSSIAARRYEQDSEKGHAILAEFQDSLFTPNSLASSAGFAIAGEMAPHIAATDPLAAFQLIAGLPPSEPEYPTEEWKTELLNRTTRGWLANDPHQAIEWLAKIPDAEGKKTLARWAVESESIPATWVREHASSIGDADFRDLLVAQAVPRWLDEGDSAEVVTAWAETLPPSTREAVTSKLSDIRQGEISQEALARASNDPETTLTWLEQLPPEDVTPDAYRNLVDGWVRQDAWAASEWVTRLPAGSHRDQAAAALARGLTGGNGEDRDAALQWASFIDSPGVRRDSLTHVFQEWFRDDPGTAYQRLDRLELSREDEFHIRAQSKAN